MQLAVLMQKTAFAFIFDEKNVESPTIRCFLNNEPCALKSLKSNEKEMFKL
jgi:hypothetical protein